MGVSENVDIKATADTNAALSALQQINANLERLVTTGNRTQESMDGMFERGVAGAVSMTAAVLGVGGAMAAMQQATRAAMATYEDWQARQKQAANTQVTFADAQRRFANVLGKGTSIESATKRIMDISDKTGAKPEVLGLMLETALSAKGPALSDETGFQAVAEAAAYRPDGSAQEGGAIVQALLSMKKTDPRLNSRQSMAFIRSSLRAARNTDIESFATYTLPAITQAKRFGDGSDSFADLASFFIGIGQTAEDPTGRRTSTGGINFLKQVGILTAPHIGKASVKDQFDFLLNSKKGNEIRDKMLGPMGGKPVADLSEDEKDKLAEALVGAEAKMGLKSEAKLFIPLVEFLQGGKNATWDNINAARENVYNEFDPRSVQEFSAADRELRANRLQGPASMRRGLRRAKVGFEMDNDNAMAGLKDDYLEALQAAGIRWDTRKIEGWELDANSGDDVSTLQTMRAQTLARTNRWRTEQRAEFTPNKPKADEQFERLIQKIDEQLELMKQPQEVKLDVGGGPADRGQMGAAERAGQ